jgi:alpha/beta superfamily hydrolase
MIIESKPTVIRKEKRGEVITEITDGVKKYPAVLLLSGSGSQDRDETIADHKPFAVWADYLSRSGIAVLRVDDRGMGASKGQPEFLATTTTESYVDDALAALQWLKQQPDIDTNFIFLMGHSEGANVAIKTAAKETNIRGVISLAGMTSSGIETTLFQLQPIWRKNTTDEKTLSELASITRRMATASKYYNSVSSAKKFVKDSLLKIESSRYKLAIAYLKKYDLPNSGKKDLSTLLASQIGEAYQNPWIQYYLHYDPKPEFKVVRIYKSIPKQPKL